MRRIRSLDTYLDLLAWDDRPFSDRLPKGMFQYVDVGEQDRFGRTRLPDQPSDPAEYDYAGHMMHIYADIMAAVDPEAVNDEYGHGLAGLEGLIYDWAQERWETWRHLHATLRGPEQWDRALTPEEAQSRKVTWGMRVYQTGDTTP